MTDTAPQPLPPAARAGADETALAIAALQRIQRTSAQNQALRAHSLNSAFAQADAATDVRDLANLVSEAQQATAIDAMARGAARQASYRDALAAVSPEVASTVAAHTAEPLSLAARSALARDGAALASRLDATEADTLAAASVDGHRRAFVAGGSHDEPERQEATRAIARRDVASPAGMTATWLRRDSLAAIAESGSLSPTYRDEVTRVRPDLWAEAEGARQEVRDHAASLLVMERHSALLRSGGAEMARTVATSDIEALRAMKTHISRNAELRAMADLIRDNAAYRDQALLEDAKLVELATDISLVAHLQTKAREHVQFLELPPQGNEQDLKDAIEADLQTLSQIQDPAERRNAFRALDYNDPGYVRRLIQEHPNLQDEMDRVADDDVLQEMVQGHAVLAKPGVDAEREVRAKARADREALERITTAAARLEAEALIAEAIEEQAGYEQAVQRLDELDQLQAIRARLPADKELASIQPEVASALAAADLQDLRAVTSHEQLSDIAPEIARRRDHPAYDAALVATDFKTAKAMETLAWEAMAKAEEARLSAPRRPLQGVLLEQGRAPYQGDTSQPDTFFARYVDDAGREGTVWGRHLEAALSNAGVAPGQRFALARLPTSTATIDEASPGTLSCDLTEFDVAAVGDGPQSSSQPPRATANAPDGGQVQAAVAAAAVAGTAMTQKLAPAATAPTQAPQQPPVEVAPKAAAPRSRSFGRPAANEAPTDAGEVAPPAAQGSVPPVEPAPAPPQAAQPKTAATGAKTPPAAPTAPDLVIVQKNGFTSGDAPNQRPSPVDFSKLLENITYETQKNGSVLYLLHLKPAFIDHGQQILMHKDADGDEQAILAAILLAKQKWGDKLELTGTEEFKTRALAAMVKHNIEVQFKNPEQDARWRDLKKKHAEAAAAAGAATPAGPQPLMGTPSSAVNTIKPGDMPAANGGPNPAVAAAPAAQATTLAASLAPIRARDWWLAERDIVHKSVQGQAEITKQLDKLGPEPAPGDVFWFDKSGRRADPPSDADAFVRALPVPPDSTQPRAAPQLVLRSVTSAGDGRYETTALLFKPHSGEHLQGFVVVNGQKRHVIAQVTQRPPDPTTGEIRPNFLRLLERTGDAKKQHWREIGYGNAINHRADKKPVHFDELVLTVGSDLVKARVLGDIGEGLHQRLGFTQGPTPRLAQAQRVDQPGSAGPNVGPAAEDRGAAVGMSPTLPTPVPSAPRNTPRPRAAA